MSLESLEIDREEYAHSPWSMEAFVDLLAKVRTRNLVEEGQVDENKNFMDILEKQKNKYAKMINFALKNDELSLESQDGIDEPGRRYVYYLDNTYSHPGHCLNWAERYELSIPEDFIAYINRNFSLPETSEGDQLSLTLSGAGSEELALNAEERRGAWYTSD